MLNDNVSKKILYFFIIFVIFFILLNLKNFYFKKHLVLDGFEDKKYLVVKDDYFNLKGETQDVKNLFVNKKEYYLDENNNFNINLFLFHGFNRFYVKAITKNNKEIIREITIFNNKK